MHVRGQLDMGLKKIEEEIMELAEYSTKALNLAIDALYNQDMELATDIVTSDKILDEKELQINEETILLIARQQPVATDLRTLITALKISSDLERMGDNAKNIAKASIHLGPDHGLTIHPMLKEMRDIAVKMIDLAEKAYQYKDITLAGKLAELDDQVDEMYGMVVREMLEETAANPQKIQHIMQMAFCARYIERFADHTTNIAESIIYLVKGKTYDLN